MPCFTPSIEKTRTLQVAERPSLPRVPRPNDSTNRTKTEGPSLTVRKMRPPRSACALQQRNVIQNFARTHDYNLANQNWNKMPAAAGGGGLIFSETGSRQASGMLGRCYFDTDGGQSKPLPVRPPSHVSTSDPSRWHLMQCHLRLRHGLLPRMMSSHLSHCLLNRSFDPPNSSFLDLVFVFVFSQSPFSPCLLRSLSQPPSFSVILTGFVA
jgi:hypothetical protein